jgi:hypothetical protein
MRVINLFAGPGAGKSTTAYGLTHFLKVFGVNCEFVHEEAKEFTWEKRYMTLACQPYIFGKQMRNLWRLQDQVDVVVTDSPILLSLAYATSEWPDSFKTYVVDQFNEFNNINYFLRRNNKPYLPVGRSQTAEEAGQLDQKILRIMLDNNVNMITIESSTEWCAETAKRLAQEIFREKAEKVVVAKKSAKNG